MKGWCLCDSGERWRGGRWIKLKRGNGGDKDHEELTKTWFFQVAVTTVWSFVILGGGGVGVRVCAAVCLSRSLKQRSLQRPRHAMYRCRVRVQQEN